MDLHTSNLFRLVRTAADKYRKVDGPQLPKPYSEADPALPTEHLPYIARGVDVAARDDDAPVRPLIAKWFIHLNNSLSPFRDKPELWASPDAGRAAIQATFGKYLPKVAVTWKDSGAEVTELWARQGLGAQHLTRVTEGGQPGEAFVSSFEFMAGCAVRPGLVPYGGAVYLSADGRLHRLHLQGKDFRPGEPGWDHAAFVYRTSSLVWATLSDHLFRCHYLFMNPIVLATKRFLPLAHPLRHFIAPFHYRTAAINNGAALTLAPVAGAVHRATGLEWEALRAAYHGCVDAYRYETFPAALRRRGMHPDDLGADQVRLFPFSSDGMEYWKRVRAFVDDAFDQSPAMGRVLGEGRETTARWWEAIGAAFPDLPALGEESLRDFLTQIIHTVTGFHEHVGNVSQYIANPSLVSGKLWPGQTISDQQGSYQLSVVACITGLPMPKLMEDFSHLMPDPESAAALRRFQAALAAWQAEVDTRNQARPQPFISFSPRELSCSISI